MADRQKISIGQIDYANAWPIFHGLRLDGDYMESVARVPSELNRMLAAGELQVSAMSSYAYAINSDKLLLLPGLSVGSVGRVNSLFFFSKKPVDTDPPERIALTSTSATTVNLLKILMESYYGLHPEYISMEPSLDRMLEQADGALLIGDPAIHAFWTRKDLHCIDLGELWHRFTGRGMTYAVVAVRRDAAEAWPDAIGYIHRALLDNMAGNVSNLDPVVARACREHGGEESFWRSYFGGLQYDLNPRLLEGLELYCRYAKELGLLERDTELAFFRKDKNL